MIKLFILYVVILSSIHTVWNHDNNIEDTMEIVIDLNSPLKA